MVVVKVLDHQQCLSMAWPWPELVIQLVAVIFVPQEVQT
jgi:hypothetical protein